MARLMNLQTGEVVYLQPLHTIGRQSGVANIGLTQLEASLNHATITWDGEHWLIQDCSNNGTYINGVRISHEGVFRINKDEKVCFGNPDSDSWQLLDEKPPKRQRGRVSRGQPSLINESRRFGDKKIH